MTQSLYEEALADAVKVSQVAEDNAKRAIIEAVLPRVKNMIESEILGEGCVDDVANENDEPEEEENLIKAISQLDGMSESAEHERFVNDIKDISGMLDEFKNAKHDKGLLKKINEVISRVELVYDDLQDNVKDEGVKGFCSEKLEELFSTLKNTQETIMAKNRLNEEEELDLDVDAGEGEDVDLDVGGDDGASDGELTLKLSGLPDGLDLDAVGVDLVGGAEDEEMDMDMDLDVDGDEDMDLDMDVGGDEDQVQMEGRKLDENTIVEIDENMLRREIARMTRLSEGEGFKDDCCDANGHGVEGDEFDDFGGAEEEGEPLDHHVRTAVDEGMDDMLEMEEMDEMDEMDENDAVSETRNRLSFERNMLGNLKRKIGKIRNEARGQRGMKLSLLRGRHNKLVKSYNESLRRVKYFENKLNENRSSNGRLNSNRSRQADPAVNRLRKELSDRNLHNTKLTYANKVLQSESLTKKQKAQVIRAFDKCKTNREAKLVYESVVKQLTNRKRNSSLSEGKVVGSGSRVTSKGSLNEGVETNRWTKLAGIK